MKLLCCLSNPYARKVRIVMAEKRIDYELVSTSAQDPAIAQFNPLGQVPVLIMDDGSALFDSRVIVEYLSTVTPVGRLVPDDPRQRIYVKRWEALADGLNAVAVSLSRERARPADQQSADWMVAQERIVFRVLEAMSEELGEKAWCGGENFSLADIAAGCAIHYLSFRFPEIEWYRAHPNLAHLADKLSERPSFKGEGYAED